VLLAPRTSHDQDKAEFAAQKASLALYCLGRDHPSGLARRLRVERCFAGPVYLVTTPVMPASWPYAIANEWRAMIKALVFQRGC
jgi:hypothetical protein